MFGIGTAELVVILVIAMLVVGPERMVELSREFGALVAKFRSETDSVTREFKEALNLEEMQAAVEEIQTSVKDVDGALRESAEEANDTIAAAKKTAESVAAEITTPFVRHETALAPENEPSEPVVLADSEPVAIDVGEYVAPDDEIEPVELEQTVWVEDEPSAQEPGSPDAAATEPIAQEDEG